LAGTGTSAASFIYKPLYSHIAAHYAAMGVENLPSLVNVIRAFHLRNIKTLLTIKNREKVEKAPRS
jgi:hypothetical protein